MDRKKFLQTSAVLTAASLLPPNSVFAQNLESNGIDKLADAEGNFIQPALPYNTNFLEPNMDEETVKLHYANHHGGAVKGANKDMQMIRAALDSNNLETVDSWTKKLSYHLSSHILHSIFWTNLTNKKTTPSGALLKQVEKDFGTLDKLNAYLSETSKNVDGVGWGILGYQPYTNKLTILQCENHEKMTQWGVVPLLVIDVWEHAYYLKYKNKRGDFVDAMFNVLNWDNVAERFNAAQKLR
jgi:superoxide dismutase, Fe-Mn family